MREEVGLWYSLVWKRARAAAFDFVVSQEVRDQKRERLALERRRRKG
jgi:hypothetical protein